MTINDQLKALQSNRELFEDQPSRKALFDILLQMNGWIECEGCGKWHEPCGMHLLACSCGYRFDVPRPKLEPRSYKSVLSAEAKERIEEALKKVKANTKPKRSRFEGGNVYYTCGHVVHDPGMPQDQDWQSEMRCMKCRGFL